MRRFVRGLLTLMLFDALFSPLKADERSAAAEADFAASISAASIGSFIEDMTAHPDFPGSPWDKRNAEKTLSLFKSWGLSARIETFEIRFPTPAERIVELLAPTPFTASLHEPAVVNDPYSLQQSEQIPAYFVYGPDGDVTAPLVYANYGLREDYDTLTRLGVSLEGAIIIIRAGHMWRGGKVELAAEHGVKGVLIYSDPREDGYYQGPVYPEGGWRNADAVQRGSILNGIYCGDPLKPFAGPRAGREVSPNDPMSSVARIPAMPLSYADAQPLLAALDGPTVPESWRGALPLTYRSGPGPAVVHLRIKYRWDRIKIYDVIATIKGSTYPDEWVVRGNHRDGWVYGAQDPHSGHSAMLEEARAVGSLLRSGWQPKRTIIYASWDGEEQGTIGSSLWVESHLKELRRRAVAYVNTDITGPGALRLAGASSFTNFLTLLAKDVKDPNSGVSALERLRTKAEIQTSGAGSGYNGASGLEDGGASFDLSSQKVRLAPPGYGSDHHAFVAHAGIAALLLEFGDQINLGAYHSIYDNFAWYQRFGDPGFKYGLATAQFNGLAVLRLASTDVIPQRFGATASALQTEVQALIALYEAARQQALANLQDVALHATQVLQDPANPRSPPEAKPIEELELAPLVESVAAVREAAQRYDAQADDSIRPLFNRSQVHEINLGLINVERSFLRPGGLPGRPYYSNEIYAPGRLWDTVPLPAIGDAILDGHWILARNEIPKTAVTIRGIAHAIDAATQRLRLLNDRVGKKVSVPLWVGHRRRQTMDVSSGPVRPAVHSDDELPRLPPGSVIRPSIRYSFGNQRGRRLCGLFNGKSHQTTLFERSIRLFPAASH